MRSRGAGGGGGGGGGGLERRRLGGDFGLAMEDVVELGDWVTAFDADWHA